jgi:hypothetical protein
MEVFIRILARLNRPRHYHDWEWRDRNKVARKEVEK